MHNVITIFKSDLGHLHRSFWAMVVVAFMDEQVRYEELYRDMIEQMELMHKDNLHRIKIGFRSILIVPTIFLLLLFFTSSSKTVFLVLWIVSMYDHTYVRCLLSLMIYPLISVPLAFGGKLAADPLMKLVKKGMAFLIFLEASSAFFSATIRASRTLTSVRLFTTAPSAS